MKRVTLLLLCACSLQASSISLYRWTINSGQGSVTYSVGSDGSNSVSGYVEGLPSYFCSQLSAEDCISWIEFVPASQSIVDLTTNFGNAAIWLCWDASSSGCTTGFDVTTGASFPTFEGAYGTYQGTMDFTGYATTLVYSDPPGADSPEPGTWGLLACGITVIKLARKWGRLPH